MFNICCSFERFSPPNNACFRVSRSFRTYTWSPVGCPLLRRNSNSSHSRAVQVTVSSSVLNQPRHATLTLYRRAYSSPPLRSPTNRRLEWWPTCTRHWTTSIRSDAVSIACLKTRCFICFLIEAYYCNDIISTCWWKEFYFQKLAKVTLISCWQAAWGCA